MQVSASSFKAYDIRGVVGRDIDETFAEHLGRAFGTEALALGEKAVAVGRDKEYRRSLSERIRSGHPLLFDRDEPVRALEEFFISVAR